jgi:2-oxoglutarate ferredoxin oxidoreductase subunit alpha
MPSIHSQFICNTSDQTYLPYKRQANFARQHALPGSPGLEHRIGGLEKEHETGNISYDAANHEFMVKMRAAKVAKVADDIPEQTLALGNTNSKALVIGWGSTYGSIHQAIIELNAEGLDLAQLHLSYIQPMPKNIAELIKAFDVVMVVEMNNGQLIKVIRDQFLVDAKGIHKIQGQPFQVQELKASIKQIINA